MPDALSVGSQVQYEERPDFLDVSKLFLKGVEVRNFFDRRGWAGPSLLFSQSFLPSCSLANHSQSTVDSVPPVGEKLQFYLSHRAALFEDALPIVGDRMRAEDLLQETFMLPSHAHRAPSLQATC